MKLFLVSRYLQHLFFNFFYHDKKIDIQEKRRKAIHKKSFLYARISQSNSFFLLRVWGRNRRCRVWAVVLKGAKFTNQKSFIFASTNKQQKIRLPPDLEREKRFSVCRGKENYLLAFSTGFLQITRDMNSEASPISVSSNVWEER